MGPYVMAEDLYQHKLAVILGRGKRLKKVLRKYPTEKKFKSASIEEIGTIIGIKNSNSSILKKLQEIDITYDKMITFLADPGWSRRPRARKIMGIDTEYLKSGLDSIQYVLAEGTECLSTGIILTNEKLGNAVSISEGINHLRGIIEEFKPEIIVGHNFNSDISIMETAYGDELPELYYYDDTMELLLNSNLANIIGSSSLNETITKVFKADTIGLFSAYGNLNLFVEYGIKDALYPIYLRHYILNGSFDEVDFNLEVDTIIKETNRPFLELDNLRVSLKRMGG